MHSRYDYLVAVCNRIKYNVYQPWYMYILMSFLHKFFPHLTLLNSSPDNIHMFGQPRLNSNALIWSTLGRQLWRNVHVLLQSGPRLSNTLGPCCTKIKIYSCDRWTNIRPTCCVWNNMLVYCLPYDYMNVLLRWCNIAPIRWSKKGPICNYELRQQFHFEYPYTVIKGI